MNPKRGFHISEFKRESSHNYYVDSMFFLPIYIKKWVQITLTA